MFKLRHALRLSVLASGTVIIATTKFNQAPVKLDGGPSWVSLPKPSEKTIEPTTKIPFSNSVNDVDDRLYRLCVVSVRCMLGACFLDRAIAYAYGIYLGSDSVKLLSNTQKLNEINPLPTEQYGYAPFYPSSHFSGRKEGYVFQTGEAGLGYYMDSKKYRKGKIEPKSTPIMIRLVMHHDVDGEHISHGFDKSLKPRIAKHMLKESRVEFEQLRRFNLTFERLGTIEKGSQIDLFRNEYGVLLLLKDGEMLDYFDASLLGWACIDVFIGEKGHLSIDKKKELITFASTVFKIKPLTEFYDN